MLRKLSVKPEKAVFRIYKEAGDYMRFASRSAANSHDAGVFEFSKCKYKFIINFFVVYIFSSNRLSEELKFVMKYILNLKFKKLTENS